MTLISLQKSPVCDSALLADAKNSSAFTAMPTMFATDNCNEAHNTMTSPDLLAGASTIIISFLAALHGLPALAKLHPSAKTEALFHELEMGRPITRMEEAYGYRHGLIALLEDLEGHGAIVS
ncbi:hypothetical protein KP509_12G048000 [Ceratopteris richardii]|nr:hypothetical protein KP509_12G048000 [Ceratopteris richardii]